MVDDVFINKAAIIERCLLRITEEYQGHESELTTHCTRQDSIILNLQRACEAAIDAGMHWVRVRRLGIPQESRQVFSLLYEAGILNQEMADHLKAMVGFRNVAVHDYLKLNLDILRSLLENRLTVFRDFSKILLKQGAA
jgi:uncharacterized protein YutE (UPF0331/DUF86 family)